MKSLLQPSPLSRANCLTRQVMIAILWLKILQTYWLRKDIIEMQVLTFKKSIVRMWLQIASLLPAINCVFQCHPWMKLYLSRFKTINQRVNQNFQTSKTNSTSKNRVQIHSLSTDLEMTYLWFHSLLMKNVLQHFITLKNRNQLILEFIPYNIRIVRSSWTWEPWELKTEDSLRTR